MVLRGIVIGVVFLSCFAGSMVEAAGAVAEVEGFRSTYEDRATPKKDWGAEAEAEWIAGFHGKLEAQKGLAYRQLSLPAGKHDVWTEKGKGDWFHLYVGDREDEEAPRLRALFKLYPVEEGVEKLRFDLKLVRKGTKLKFSIFAGKSEGHGNLRIVEPQPK